MFRSARSALRAVQASTSLGYLLRRVAMLDVLGALCGILTLLLVAAWVTGISRHGFDYDELEHAHVLWLIQKGLRPFSDFFEDHPPFLWYPLSAFARLWGENYAVLFVYRGLTAVGHVLFLIAIARNLALSFRRLRAPLLLSGRTFLLSAALVAGYPPILDYLLEFRLDAWPNALLLFAVYRYRQASALDGRQILKASASFVFLAAAAVLCSPKLMAFLALFSLASLATANRRLRRLEGFIAGGLAALAVAALVLRIGRISFVDFFKLIFVYHQILNQKGGFGHGLALAVWQHPVMLAIVMASAIACLVTLRGKIISSPFELAVLAFSAFQLWLVSFRYKQYYGPWFLLAVTFIPYLDLALRRVRPLHSLILAAAVLFATTNALAARQSYLLNDDATTENGCRTWLEQRVPPQDFVAASCEMMPLFRREAFYHWTTSYAPSGHGTESIMQDLGMGTPFTEAHYQQELESKRPKAIILEGALPPPQRKAAETYLSQAGARYRRLDSPRGPVFLREP